VQETLDEMIDAVLRERSGDELDDLAAAVIELERLLTVNPLRMATIITALHRRLSWSEIAERTGIPPSTLRNRVSRHA